MKAAISLPDHLFRAADRAAKCLGLSRSELYQRALALFLEQQGDRLLTEALNEVYAAEASSVSPVLMKMQRGSLATKHW